MTKVALKFGACGFPAGGFLLFLDDDVVAYLYAPIVGSRVVSGFLGYDAKHQKLPPGTALQLLVMKRCFDNEDLKLFDFPEGDGEALLDFA